MDGTAEYHQSNDCISLLSKSIIWDRNRARDFPGISIIRIRSKNVKRRGAVREKFWRETQRALNFPLSRQRRLTSPNSLDVIFKTTAFLNDLNF